jgi:hypothetical protein
METQRKISYKNLHLGAALFFLCGLLVFVFSFFASLKSVWDPACLGFFLACALLAAFALFLEHEVLIFFSAGLFSHVLFFPFVLFLFLPLFNLALFSGQFLGFFRTDGPPFIFGIFNFVFFIVQFFVFSFSSSFKAGGFLKKPSFRNRFSFHSLHKITGVLFCLWLIGLASISGFSCLSPEGRLNGLAIEVSKKAAKSESGYSIATVSNFSDTPSCSQLIDSFANSTYLASPLFGVSTIQTDYFLPTLTVESCAVDCGILSTQTFSTYLNKNLYISDSSSLTFVGLNLSVSENGVVPLCICSKAGTTLSSSLGLSSPNDLLGKRGTITLPLEKGLKNTLETEIVNICDGSSNAESFYLSCYGNFGLIPREFFEKINASFVSADFPLPSIRVYSRDVCAFLLTKVGEDSSRLSVSSWELGRYSKDSFAASQIDWICTNHGIKDGFCLAGLICFYIFGIFAFFFAFLDKGKHFVLNFSDLFFLSLCFFGSVCLLFLCQFFVQLFAWSPYFLSTLFLLCLILSLFFMFFSPFFISFSKKREG